MNKITVTLLLVLIINIQLNAGTPLTVNDAIDMALVNNETYLSAQEELVKAKNQVYEVRSSAFPQLNAGLTVLRNWELSSFVMTMDNETMRIISGTNYSWTSELTITQPIYNGGSVFAAWSIAKLYKRYSENLLDMQRQELKLSVIELYYGLVMANELERVANQTVELAEENLEVVKNMQAQGMVSDYEVLMAEVRLANVKPSYIEAKANAKLARQSLNTMVGLDINEQTDVVWNMDSTLYFVPDYDIDSLKQAAINNRPELNMVDLEAKMRKKNITVARAGYRPKLNFLTTLQYQALYNDDKWPDWDDWERSSYTGIVLDIPIFDSWRTPAKVKQAKIEYKQAQLSLQELEDNLKLDIEQSWWNYKKARENFSSQGQAVEMARRGLEIGRVRYSNGVGTQLELFESEVALATAENNRVMAFYDLVTSYATLMKAIGEEKLLR